MNEEEHIKFTPKEFQDLISRLLRLGQMEGFSKGLAMWPHMYTAASGWIDTGDGKRIQTEEGRLAQKIILDALDNIKEDNDGAEDDGHH